MKALLYAAACLCALLCSERAIAQQPAPVPPLNPEVYDDYLGTYRLESGRLIVIARTERRLYAYEPGSERVRGLERVDDETWIAGPSLLVYSPESYRLKFIKAHKSVTGLWMSGAGGKPLRAMKAHLYREENVSFRNDSVVLRGTLLLPTTKPPYPAIVMAHGSGAQDRNGFVANIRFMADHLARHGIAVLTFDKRGSGRSSGNWKTASFQELGSDVVAGVRLLRNRTDIEPAAIGVGGSSQAGWVTAKAVGQDASIGFVMLVSAAGSAYTVEQQNLYNTQTEMRAAANSEDRITRALELQRRFFGVLDSEARADAASYDNAVRSARQDSVLRDWLMPLSTEINRQTREEWYTALEVNFDPLTAWRAYKGPVLGVFGELDAETPVAEVLPKFADALVSRSPADFTIRVFPRASHLLLAATKASDEELPRLQRFVPGFFDFVSAWILSEVEKRKP